MISFDHVSEIAIHLIIDGSRIMPEAVDDLKAHPNAGFEISFGKLIHAAIGRIAVQSVECEPNVHFIVRYKIHAGRPLYIYVHLCTLSDAKSNHPQGVTPPSEIR